LLLLLLLVLLLLLLVLLLLLLVLVVARIVSEGSPQCTWLNCACCNRAAQLPPVPPQSLPTYSHPGARSSFSRLFQQVDPLTLRASASPILTPWAHRSNRCPGRRIKQFAVPLLAQGSGCDASQTKGRMPVGELWVVTLWCVFRVMGSDRLLRCVRGA
jgi:hypothetical protein